MEKEQLKKETTRILQRQQARLLEFLIPVNPPEITKDAIKKYFNYAIEDVNEAIDNGGMGYGANNLHNKI